MELRDKRHYHQQGFDVDAVCLEVLTSIIKALFENPRLKASGKLVLMLQDSSEYKLQTGVLSDSEKGERHVIHEEILCAFDNYFSVTFTQVSNSASLIPIIYFLKKSKDFVLVGQLLDSCQNQLPSSCSVIDRVGSKYFICSSHLLGNLWKIHEDRYRLKAHFVLSHSIEKFIWYKKDEDKFETVDELEFKYKNLYLLDVSTFHTSHVEKYFENRPRIHLVMDLH